MENIYEQYKRDHMPKEEEKRPIVEYNGFDPKAKTELAYLGKSANVGWAKFNDFITPKSNESYKDSLDPKKREIYQKDQIAKEAVLDAMRERDEFYMANSEDISFGTQLAGGLVETIFNPFEVGAQLGLATFSSGTSILTQLALQGGFDLAQANLESLRYEDRILTPKENLMVGATSVAPDLLMIGAGALMRKAKSALLKEANILGDKTINVRNTINTFDDMGMYKGSKAQQMYTDSNGATNIKFDPYKINGTLKKPSDIYGETYFSSLPEPTRRGLEASLKDYNPYKNEQTILQRTYGEYKNIDNIDNILNDKRNFAEFGDLINNIRANKNNVLNDTYGKGFNNKTGIQKAIIIQNKENDLVDQFAKNVKPTVDDYYDRWKIASNKKPEVNPKIHLNTEQIDNALNHIDTRFQTQKLYVQNEYMNIINKGYEDIPVDLNTFIKSIGADDTDVAQSWIKGNMEDLGTKNRNDFFSRAYEDSVILDELNMKTSLFDIKEFEYFNRKFGSSFDEYGDIKYDGNLFENLSKAKGDDREVLIRAIKDNPEQYTEFITNAKDLLDKIHNKKNIPQETLDQTINIFNTPLDNIKKYINKNKDFINSEYDKLIKEVPIDKSKEPKVWKKEVAEAIAKNKEKLAKESIQINQTINKQKSLAFMEQFYDGTVDRNTVGTVQLKADKVDEFIEKIIPFYQDGIINLPEGLGKELDLTTDKNLKIIGKHFAEFISEYKKTRASARVTGEYKSIGELREFFGDEQMANFFIGLNNGKYLKTNKEMIRDIFDFNTSAIARFTEYGSTSPYVLNNKFQYKLNKSMSDVYGKELSSAQQQVVNTMKQRAERMFGATQIGYAKELPSQGELISRYARVGLRRGILGGTGVSEFFRIPKVFAGQNYFIALSKAQKYGGFDVYTNQLRRIAKHSQGNLPNAKYTTAQLMKDVDINLWKKNEKSMKILQDTLLDKPSRYINFENYDHIAFMFQDMSDKQMKRFGEAQSVSMLDNLPKDFKRLENEMKDLLKINNINESNYNIFREYTHNHIQQNGNIVNMPQLLKEMDLNRNKYADVLRNVHYQLSDYIGNPMHKSKFNNVIQDEISQWYNLFRGFSRNMNGDTFRRFTQYIDANGVAKNRFGMTLINPQYIKDVGLIGIGKDMGYFAAASTALIVGGYGYSVAKEMIESDKTIKQRYATIKVNNDKITQLVTDGDFLGFISTAMDLTGTNPIEALTATDLPESLYNKIKKIYNTFTDEEKKTLGTNMEDGIQTLLDETLKVYLRIPRNIATAIYKETQGDIETMPKKVYGFNKEDMLKLEAYVRNPLFEKSNQTYYDNQIKQKQAEIDYMNDDETSYNNLSDNSKQIANVIKSNNNIKNEKDFNTHYAMIISDTNSKEELVEKIANERPYDNINVKETIDVLNNQEPQTEFEKLGQKKMDYFYMIMKYNGVERPTQKDYDLFVKHFKDIKKSKIANVLKDIYGIDKREFNELYNNEEVRNQAIKFYK